MSPPPPLCSRSVRMAVKCGICGVLDAEVSFDSCIVRTSGCVVHMKCLSEEMGWVQLGGGASYVSLCDGNMWGES